MPSGKERSLPEGGWLELRLKSLLPVAFGRFHAKEPVLLQDGLNIISGDNESGKTTLGAFISGMFYGFKKEGRTRISRTPEFERYRPWAGKEYRGTVTYEARGRVYRVERWFDPDVVRIYDDVTGEEITSEFSQDSRKEYDFAEAHLGLNAKEFRNTVWIGQLESAQDSDLGLEIQGKLENVLQGGGEDLSFVKALTALNSERGKIKTPRSTRAWLDIVQERIVELEVELAEAREREAGVRTSLVRLRELQLKEKALSHKAGQASVKAESIRARLIRKVVARASDLGGQIRQLQDRIRLTEWAKDIPVGFEDRVETIYREQDSLDARIRETRFELEKLSEKKQELTAELESYRHVLATGLDEAKVSGLHSRYLACKASASRGERHANEARRELRKLEEQGKALGLFDLNVGEDLLSEAEGLQDILMLAEKEKARCDLEVEKARAGVAQTNLSGTIGWLYALSLGVLGIAIVLTIMGLPIAIPAFGISILAFGIGSYRHKKILLIKSRAQEELDEKEVHAKEQSIRVADAAKILSEFLALQGVRSVEELRARIREVSAFFDRLKNAKGQYEIAHRYWFEASQELATVEKELTSALAAARCLRQGHFITDGVIESLKAKLVEASFLIAQIKNLDNRIEEFTGVLAQFENKKADLLQQEQELLSMAGVMSRDELDEKITVHAEYVRNQGSLVHLKEKLGVVLAGRDIEDLEAELLELEESLELNVDFGGFPEVEAHESGLSEKDYQDALKHLDEIKIRLSEIRTQSAAMEREVSLRQRQGRPVYAIEEDLARERAEEKRLSEDKDALELAAATLEDLSRNLRREFAPVLNERVGEILKEITRGRYLDVRVSPDLEMSVIHPGGKKQTPIAALSAGTVDQCYFALRVAIAELIVSKDEFPFFLDDSFVQYDDKRLEGALEIIADLSRRHQILLFSCHGREQEIARRLGIACNMVRLQL
jgi:uncharacterized protein YhaN